MLGYPLKTLMTAIEKLHGREAVVETLREAGLPLDRTYRLDMPYADTEVQRLTAAASQRLSVEDIAEAFFQDTLARFPTWYAMCQTSRQFLEMQPQIHNTFALGLQRPEERDAVRDKFRLEQLDDELVVHYRSPNRFCEIYKGIARLVFQHYQDKAT